MNSNKKSADFLAMNPFGQVPMLKDDDVVIRDSKPSWCIWPKKYGNGQRLPNDAAILAEVVAWLSMVAMRYP